MKQLIFIAFLLLAVQFSCAITTESANLRIDFTLKPAITTSTAVLGIASVINPLARNDTKGYLIAATTAIPPAPAVPTAGAYNQRAVTLYYDVIVSVQKDRYQRDSTVIADIVIINKGDVPDRDAALIYYLYDITKNKTYGESREMFEEVPPLCSRGTWNESKQMCFYLGQYLSPNIYKIQRNITLPVNATYGDWRFVAEYETQVQPKIVVYDSFQVVSILNYLLIFLLIIGIIVFYRYTKKQNQPKQKQLGITAPKNI